MQVALDTNVLAYAEGVGDAVRCNAARQLIAALPDDAVVVPVQVLGELHRVLTGRPGRPADDARDALLGWADAFSVADSTWTAMTVATDGAADHGLPIWDPLLLAAAAEQRCRLLLSEGLQQGFTWHGVTVVNPFLAPKHKLLSSFLTSTWSRSF